MEQQHSFVTCFNVRFPGQRQRLHGPQSLKCLLSVPSQKLCCLHSRGCSEPTCSAHPGSGGLLSEGALILGSHIPALLSSSTFVSWKLVSLGLLSLEDELAGLCGGSNPLQHGDPGLPHTVSGLWDPYTLRQGTRGATCSQLSDGVPGSPLTNSSSDKVQGKSGLHIYCLVAPRDSDVPHHLQPGANSLDILVLAS